MTLCVYHIPVCPFSQRVEILLELKGLRDAVSFRVVDITKPRDPHVLALSGGTTALPVLELEDGRSLKESLVLMAYFEDRFTAVPVRREDPYERGIENLLVGMERGLVSAGYTLVMNQLPEKRQALVDAYLDIHAQLDAFLVRHGSVEGPFLFERFGWAEAVFAPFFRRFAFVAYYEDVDLPDEARFARVRAWREACLGHPAAQQVTDEEIIKVYYDYSRNAGNGALPEGRRVSSFVFEPSWRERPWPPRDKYGPGATDEQLGLT
jgi:glutathione S-transferase